MPGSTPGRLHRFDTVMTDIRRHLDLIVRAARQHLADRQGASAAEVRGRIIAHLQAELPPSYAVGTGALAGDAGQQSPPVDIVISDRTIATPAPADASPYPVRSALAVIDLGLEHGERQAFEVIASVKRLRRQKRSSGKEPVKADHLPKHLFPLGIIFAPRICDIAGDDDATLSLALHALLRGMPVAERPDFFFALDPALTYRNPIIDGRAGGADAINVSREPALIKPHNCYVCKVKFTRRHFFYDYLCLACGDENYLKRISSIDLAQRRALVTGGRIRIGYAIALRLLRNGAEVIVTTRFPHDAARRYAREPDFAMWGSRLHIYGLDLRDLPAVQSFVAHVMATYPSLDILINNAAQTVRHPPSYYADLIAGEMRPHPLTPSPFILNGEGGPVANLNGEGELHLLSGSHTLLERRDGDLPDAHRQHSWTLRVDEVTLPELLEVQIVNVTAPAYFIGQLKPMLCRSPHPDRYIVNVAAVEGQFAQPKLGVHPHTNMAKAALNMLTHSAAGDLARNHIFLNSVDPGWISQQGPSPDVSEPDGQASLIPLDEADAAARVCDPIFAGIATGQPMYGRLFKDYHEAPW